MPFLLRTIRKAKWYKNPKELPWLAEGELQADALADLRTTSNTLSVWQIDDERSNLDRIIAGIAATRDNIANVDFALIDPQLLERMGFKLEHTPGETPDTVAQRFDRVIRDQTFEFSKDFSKLQHHRTCFQKTRRVIAQCEHIGGVSGTRKNHQSTDEKKARTTTVGFFLGLMLLLTV